MIDSNWRKCYYIATYVIAVVAIAGFVYSITSSKKVADMIIQAKQELEFFAKPIIQLTDYKWAALGTEPISPDNPPSGIIFSCQNTSNVTIQMRGDTNMRIFYGEKELTDIVQKREGRTGILPPGKEIQYGTIQKENFKKYLKDKKNIFAPPFIYNTPRI